MGTKERAKEKGAQDERQERSKTCAWQRFAWPFGRDGDGDREHGFYFFFFTCKQEGHAIESAVLCPFSVQVDRAKRGRVVGIRCWKMGDGMEKKEGARREDWS
ncbi:uncharacterized protein MCYG_07047 [Microsporum canis CBS 113480]|uniref:Uncharacterized protein n=1 Tax=Arthroderma otae (strain ATCC MYA-4605 / CBS 113480) TaxID=554155 RepID=C5FWE4_ARTOC|nr:uncharacterized protein MCYG_07047 [Microsporum canis CBS 113480]EEQ34228.1 predicted protein [Microsporum canis CBS 113480]